MNLIEEHNLKYKFFSDITGAAMKVHSKFHAGLLESAYEAVLKYLLEQQGYKVERQALLPVIGMTLSWIRRTGWIWWSMIISF